MRITYHQDVNILRIILNDSGIEAYRESENVGVPG